MENLKSNGRPKSLKFTGWRRSQMKFQKNRSAHVQNSSMQIQMSDFLGWECQFLRMGMSVS